MSHREESAGRLLREGLIPITGVPSLVPGGSTGKRLHRSVVWRWIREGLQASPGDRVYLEAVKVGRRWMTSSGALARFLAMATSGSESRDGSQRAPRLRPETAAVLSRHGLAEGLARREP